MLKKLLRSCQYVVICKQAKLNPNNMEFIMFSSKKQHEQVKKFFPVSILGSFLSLAEVVRNLGV